MPKLIIILTGTPCVGKTSVAQALSHKHDALYVNLTDLAIRENLILNKDERRNSLIVNEKKMKQTIRAIIDKCDKNDIVIDGHYAASVVPKGLASYVFVLRRDPAELKKLMKQSGFPPEKLWENLACEILDVCLVDALSVHGKGKVCELDVSGKRVEEVVNEILQVISGHKQCFVGVVDWLGKLESENLLEKYLRI